MQTFDWKAFLLYLQGRSTRSDYWLRYTLPYVVIAVFVGILDAVLGTHTSEEMGSVGLFGAIFTVLAIWPAIAVGVKRRHDRNRSGWFLLIALIPIVGAIWLFVELGFLRGTVGQNRFGPDPLPGGLAGAAAA